MPILILTGSLWTCLLQHSITLARIRLHSKVLARLTEGQLAAFDSLYDPSERCKSLVLNDVNPRSTARLNLDCFTNALKSAADKSVNPKEWFFERAPVDIFSKLDLKDLDKFNWTSLAWSSLQAPHVSHIWDLVKDDITKNKAIINALAPKWAGHHSHPDFNHILDPKLDVQKLPWQMLNGEEVLGKLGPTKIKALNGCFKTTGAIALYDFPAFKASMTPSQFTLLFNAND